MKAAKKCKLIRVDDRCEMLVYRANGDFVRFQYRLDSRAGLYITSCSAVQVVFTSESVSGLAQKLRRYFNQRDAS